MRTGKWLAGLSIIVAAALAVSFAAILAQRPEPPITVVPQPSSTSVLEKFKPAEPPYPAPQVTFSNPQGRALSLEDFRDKVLLVNVWATWCVPCVREMPALDRLQAALGSKDFAVLTISIDRGGQEIVTPFFQTHNLTNLTAYTDPSAATGRAFKTRGLPTSFLIDRTGHVLGQVEGDTKWDGAEAHNLIQQFMSEQ